MHGSLARAGKVRSQTPKVAKAEKKKVPKGRAFQRLKYNRRFVNVGELGGGRYMRRNDDQIHISYSGLVDGERCRVCTSSASADRLWGSQFATSGACQSSTGN